MTRLSEMIPNRMFKTLWTIPLWYLGVLTCDRDTASLASSITRGYVENGRKSVPNPVVVAQY